MKEKFNNIRPRKETLIIFGILFLTMCFFETLFRILLLDLDLALFRAYLNLAMFAIIFTFIYKILFRKIKIAFLIFLLVLLTAIYIGQAVYYTMFGDFYNFMILTNFGQATAFASEGFKNFKIGFVLYLLPIVLFILALKKKKLTNINKAKFTLSSFIVFLLAMISITTFMTSTNTHKNTSIYEINAKYEFNSTILPETAVRNWGLLTYTSVDFVENNASKSLQLSNNQMTEIKNYFNDLPTHGNNEMTGIFEDKNLVFIMAESLDEIAVREDVMPNLYKMQQEGMNFTNFYSPLFLRSTADTEFMTETSFFPDKQSSLTMKEYLGNEFPNTFANMFKELDYTATAYHNYNEKYYPRTDFYEKTLNYDSYYGDEDLDISLKDVTWPSDVELIEKATPNFISDDKFYAKIVTVSGHLSYTSSNTIVKQHYDRVKDISVDESIKNYFATQVELDDAIGTLVEEIEKAGKLDDTIFITYSDHRPYGLDNVKVDEISELDRLTDVDINRTPLVIWGNDVPNMEVENLISTIDLMPTIANMFGLDMDYESAMGKDAFASEDHVVQFANFSWKTDGSIYYAPKKKYLSLDGSNVSIDNIEMNKKDLEYIEYMQKKVYERFVVSHLALRGDYFSSKNNI